MANGQLSAFVPWLTGTWTLAQRLYSDYEDLASDAFYTRVTNYVAIFGYTILIWDHLITFDDELKYIWSKHFGSFRRNPSTYLFLINRYFTPIAFIGNLVAYFSKWSPERSMNRCKKFVRYEGSCVIIALTFADLCLLQRVRALYAASRYRHVIPGALFGVLLIQTGVFAWLITHGISVSHQDANDRACTMIFDPKLGAFWPSLSAWIPLVFDTLTIIATLYKCIPEARINSASHLFRTLVKDGIVYYSVLFAINLVLAIMIIAAPDAIKNLTAQLEQMLTVAMISRITLSLRREGRRQSTIDDTAYHKFPHPPSTHDSWYAPPRPPRALKPAHAGSDFITTSALMRDTCLSASNGLILSPNDSMRECGTTASLEFARRARSDYTYGIADVKRGRTFRPSTSGSDRSGYGYGIEHEYGSIGTTSLNSMSTTPRHIEYASLDADVESQLHSPASAPPSASLQDREPPGITVSAGSPRWNEPTSYELRTMKPASMPNFRVS